MSGAVTEIENEQEILSELKRSIQKNDTYLSKAHVERIPDELQADFLNRNGILHYALNQGAFLFAFFAVQDYGADPNFLYGSPPLSPLCLCFEKSIMKSLIKQGADPFLVIDKQRHTNDTRPYFTALHFFLEEKEWIQATNLLELMDELPRTPRQLPYLASYIMPHKPECWPVVFQLCKKGCKDSPIFLPDDTETKETLFSRIINQPATFATIKLIDFLCDPRRVDAYAKETIDESVDIAYSDRRMHAYLPTLMRITDKRIPVTNLNEAIAACNVEWIDKNISGLDHSSSEYLKSLKLAFELHSTDVVMTLVKKTRQRRLAGERQSARYFARAFYSARESLALEVLSLEKPDFSNISIHDALVLDSHVSSSRFNAYLAINQGLTGTSSEMPAVRKDDIFMILTGKRFDILFLLFDYKILSPFAVSRENRDQLISKNHKNKDVIFNIQFGNDDDDPLQNIGEFFWDKLKDASEKWKTDKENKEKTDLIQLEYARTVSNIEKKEEQEKPLLSPDALKLIYGYVLGKRESYASYE